MNPPSRPPLPRRQRRSKLAQHAHDRWMGRTCVVEAQHEAPPPRTAPLRARGSGVCPCRPARVATEARTSARAPAACVQQQVLHHTSRNGNARSTPASDRGSRSARSTGPPAPRAAACPASAAHVRSTSSRNAATSGDRRLPRAAKRAVARSRGSASARMRGPRFHATASARYGIPRRTGILHSTALRSRPGTEGRRRSGIRGRRIRGAARCTSRSKVDSRSHSPSPAIRVWTASSRERPDEAGSGAHAFPLACLSTSRHRPDEGAAS